MNKLYILVIILYIFLNPFYLYPSGTPQPADVIIAIGALVFVFLGDLKIISQFNSAKLLTSLVALIFIINLTYFFWFTSQGIDNKMYLPIIFYFYNFVFFLIFLKTISIINYKELNIIGLSIILSLGIQVFLAIIGIQGGVKDDNSRPSIFFNNPNQLGYYSLLMLSLFALLPTKYRQKKIILIITIALSFFLAIYSGSRAAILGIILLSTILVFKQLFVFKLSSVFFLILFIIVIHSIYNTESVQESKRVISIRNERFSGTNISEINVRGYDRILIYPEYIFFGAGEGKYDRFKSYHNLEIHSGFGTILFSYGILGFTLFSLFVFYSIKNGFASNIVLLLPIFIYNMSHNGFRTSLFWAIFATFYIYNNKKIFHSNGEN